VDPVFKELLRAVIKIRRGSTKWTNQEAEIRAHFLFYWVVWCSDCGSDHSRLSSLSGLNARGLISSTLTLSHCHLQFSHKHNSTCLLRVPQYTGMPIILPQSFFAHFTEHTSLTQYSDQDMGWTNRQSGVALQ